MEQNNHKKITFSGIQPTGIFTLGNYLGAVRNWKLMQEEYNCCYSIVNQHAITVRQDPKALRENTLSAYALLLACGSCRPAAASEPQDATVTHTDHQE